MLLFLFILYNRYSVSLCRRNDDLMQSLSSCKEWDLCVEVFALQELFIYGQSVWIYLIGYLVSWVFFKALFERWTTLGKVVYLILIWYNNAGGPDLAQYAGKKQINRGRWNKVPTKSLKERIIDRRTTQTINVLKNELLLFI